jgi:glutathione S-transferase
MAASPAPGLRIAHVALPADWERAEANGSYDVSTRGVSLVEADFVHAATASQLPAVLDTFYADVTDVVLLVLDVDRLEHEGASVVWEHVDGADEPFPHVYGIVPVSAVVDRVRMAHLPGDPWTIPDLAAHGITEHAPPAS